MGRKVKISSEETKIIDNNPDANIAELSEMTGIDPYDLELIVKIRRDDNLRGRQGRGGRYDMIQLTEEQKEWLRKMEDYILRKRKIYELFCKEFDWPHSERTLRRRIDSLKLHYDGNVLELTDNHKEWIKENWTGVFEETWRKFQKEFGAYCSNTAWKNRVKDLGYEGARKYEGSGD